MNRGAPLYVPGNRRSLPEEREIQREEILRRLGLCFAVQCLVHK